MKRFATIFCLIFATVTVAQNRPKLVVAIVVDQMRNEMLDRFAEDFGSDGFNLISQRGTRYDSCHFQYIPTYTGPGHATIFTGNLPQKHGIISNNIYHPSLGQTVYCVEDASAEPVGSTDPDAARSPRLLRTQALGDILKSTHPGSKTITLSIKDRGAILAGGKNPDGVYWMDNQGHMVTSTQYMQMLPDWVKAFNEHDLVSEYMLDEWTLLNPIESYNESAPDNAPYETQLLGTGNTLPYDLSKLLKKKGPKGIAYTPFGNTVLTEFALDALEAEQLGNNESTDLLAIMYSSPDYIGHAFGPQSVEVQDTYLRLDQELSKLIKALDKQVGREDYILFLTADHGAANTPIDSSFAYVKPAALKELVNTYTTAKYQANLVAHIGSSQIWLDETQMETYGLDEEQVVTELTHYLNNQNKVPLENVFTQFQVETCTSEDCLPLKNAFDSNLSGHLFYIRPYGHIEWDVEYGTSHGTGYPYDTHVPLLFFGKNVKPTHVKTPVGTHQIIGELQNFFW